MARRINAKPTALSLCLSIQHFPPSLSGETYHFEQREEGKK